MTLNYQEPPPPGKRTGRYIDQPDQGDAVDVHAARPVLMHDGRELQPPAALETTGFELRSHPSACTDFRSDAEVVRSYYGEMIELIKQTSGAKRCAARRNAPPPHPHPPTPPPHRTPPSPAPCFPPARSRRATSHPPT